MEAIEQRGRQICIDLAWYGHNTEWYIDPGGELLLIIDDRWLMRCVGEREFNGELLPHWVPVYPTHQSLRERSLGLCRKLDYSPIFESI